ncbi:MAG: 1-deoxy-D-xylulose-5-phosphate reductoisomerase, partial [Pseudomonadota bacterium]
ALNWPDRRYLPVDRLNLADVGRLDFGVPDLARYPAIGIARAVMARGGLAGAVFNAAKEAALDLFLDRRIRFTDMAPLVERVLERMDADGRLDAAEIKLDMVLKADRASRAYAAEAA